MYHWFAIAIIAAVIVALLIRYCGNGSSTFMRLYNTAIQGASVESIRRIYTAAKTHDPFIAGELLRYFAPEATKTAIIQYTAAVKDLHKHADYNYRIDNMRDYSDEVRTILFGDIESLRAKIRKHRAEYLKKKSRGDTLEQHITHPVRPQSVHDSSAINMVAATIAAIEPKIEERIAYPVQLQSVHDTAAVNMVADSVAAVSKDADEADIPQYLVDIRAAIAHKLPADKQADAILALDRCETTNAYIDRYGKTELDVLSATWSRSLIPENAGNRDNIQEAILLALADSVQNGIVVCAMGRATNIISALGGTDHDASVGIILDTTALRNMCYELAAKLRDAGRPGEVGREITEAYGKFLKPADLASVIRECEDALA